MGRLFGFVVGQQESRVGADLKVQLAGVLVLHCPGHLHRAALETITGFQPQKERIDLPTVGVDHPQTAHTRFLEPAVAGETVLLHGIAPAVDVQLVVEGLPHYGEKDRRMTVPVVGVARPHVFAAVFLEAYQFGSLFGHFDGDGIVA